MSIFGALAVTALLLASLGLAAAPAMADGGAGTAYLVGFHEEPRHERGDQFHGADVTGVNHAIDLITVLASDPEGFEQRAKNDPQVRYLTRDVPDAFRPNYVPNDPKIDDQWGWDPAPGIDAYTAWDTTLGSTTTVVAVLDSGLEKSHEDIGNYLQGRDVINDDTSPEDNCGHGTHVAGTIGALTDNGVGVAGTAQTTLLPVKVLDSSSSGCAGSFSAVANGITWATDQGADVISMSLGCDGCSDSSVSDALEYAWSNGVLIVASAGNSGPCSDCVGFPANHPRAMAISALDADGTLASYSSTGPEVELTGPGSGILSTYISNSYKKLSGTSMSAPHVSGTAALLLAHNGTLDNQGLRDHLKSTSVDLSLAAEEQGAGAVNAGNALASEVTDPPEESQVLFEDLDDGAADGWALSGLWHVTDACTTPPSTPNHLAYTQDSTCTYDTGSQTTGTATFQVDLTDATVGTLSFDHRWETESYDGEYDVMRVQASTDDGGSWTTLKQWDSRDDNQLGWTAQSLDLDAYTGGALTLRFFFDTKDSVANGYEGWFLDNVEVTADLDSNAAPTASFTTSCEHLTCSFDGSGSSDDDGNITSYDWDLGDGSTATGATVDHTFETDGTYTVTLTVTDDEGATDASSQDVTVASNKAPTADAGPDQSLSDDDGDGLETVTLDGSGSTDSDGTIANHTWDLGDGEVAYGAIVEHTYAAGASYTASLTVTDDDGATDTDTATITVSDNQAPTAAYTSSCTKLDCSFDASGSSDPDGTIDSYAWDLGDGTTATGVTVDHTYSAAGDYTVTLTVTDNGGATDTETKTISVVENQPPVADAGADRTVSDDDGSGDESLTLDGSGSSDPDGSIASYDWYEGSTLLATGATPTVTLDVGDHALTLVVTDDEGATDSDTVNVTVAANQAPTASFTVSCSDLSCSFDASGSSDPDGTIDSYAWDLGDGTTATGVTVDHTYSAAGDYTVTLTVTDNGGATDTTSKTVSVTEASDAPMHVHAIAHSEGEGPPSKKDIHATVDIRDGEEAGLSGVSVCVEMTRTSDGTTYSACGTTGSTGDVTLTWSSAGRGTYETCVTSLDKDGHTWDQAADHASSGSCHTSQSWNDKLQ